MQNFEIPLRLETAKVLNNDKCRTTLRTHNVLKAFNTWRFKREQPSDADVLHTFVASALSRTDAISFVLYWGKGRRSLAGPHERQCLSYLAGMAERIQDVYSPGARFEILYTDTHAKLNGYAPSDINQYGESLRGLADSDLFFVHRLSDVCASAHPETLLLSGPDHSGETELIGKLERCAEKWYRGGGSARDGATEYLAMNMVERLAVQTVFPTSIFITFNGSEFRALFPPRLPIFYMYSTKKGNSVKPWFMDEGERGQNS